MPMNSAEGLPGGGLLGQPADAQAGQPRRLDPVEGRRVAALLEVSEDALAHVEQPAALLLEERAHERRVVHVVGVLAPDHQAQPLALL